MESVSHSVILGGGCFWCLEAVYQFQEGVTKVISGYAGGQVDNPDYRSVCSGKTGHAEVIKIEFDPSLTSLETLLGVFWKAHDPTTLNQQGADVGTQYRSIILANSPEQLVVARESASQAKDLFSGPLTTEIKLLETFYPAEVEHQNFAQDNPYHPYVQVVIVPKLKKFGCSLD
ncbi:MAG: peptide-methionine (S)-S-oxide reductase MsrA [Verrucomicrobiales bacterium]